MLNTQSITLVPSRSFNVSSVICSKISKRRKVSTYLIQILIKFFENLHSSLVSLFTVTALENIHPWVGRVSVGFKNILCWLGAYVLKMGRTRLNVLCVPCKTRKTPCVLELCMPWKSMRTCEILTSKVFKYLLKYRIRSWFT